MTKKTLLASALVTLLAASPAAADGHQKNVLSDVDVNLSGWARVDYGIGEDRYTEAQGDDQFGISKAALITEASAGDFTLTATLGTTLLSNESNDDIEFKELYLTWQHSDTVSTVWGLQPLNFGLKPAGYRGDERLVDSLEYGGAGGINTSGQIAHGVRAVIDVADGVSVELAAFDTSATSATTAGGSGVDGSSLFDNLIGQIRVDDAIIDGMYAAAGLEGVYVGATDDTETLASVGAGYGCELADLSVEWIQIAQEIAGTADDENIVVVELAVTPSERVEILFDWATADEREVDTIRTGVGYKVSDNVKAELQYALDDPDTGQDVESVDARVTFSF